jgi:hypothetical protein
MNEIRIVSDGTTYGTKVLTRDGAEIVCKAVRFSHNGGELPVVTLELIGVAVELKSSVS